MDNIQMPQMPSIQTQQPLSVPPAVSVPPVAIGGEKKKGGVVGIILAIVFFLTTATFVGLFVWSKMEYAELEEKVNLKIDEAVSEAKTEQALADAEEAKKDTRTFTGPTDYGQLSFEYPKSWSVYVESDASNGGDFMAYLNPVEIEPVSKTSVYALRVMIQDKGFEAVAKEYQRSLESGELSIETITVGETTAHRYTGKIPGTDLNGVIVIFKIRDKTAVLRTDSTLLVGDFDKVLSTIKFKE